MALNENIVNYKIIDLLGIYNICTNVTVYEVIKIYNLIVHNILVWSHFGTKIIDIMFRSTNVDLNIVSILFVLKRPQMKRL
jgi:hypothetical protein